MKREMLGSVDLRTGRRRGAILVVLLALLGLAQWRLARVPTHVRAQDDPPRLWLGTARAVEASSYRGTARALAAMAAHPTPLSLATADLDGDGIGDLAIGMNTREGRGLLAIHRGNLDAFAPQSEASFWAIARSQFPAPYLPEGNLVEIPGPPDFLASGDFIGLGGAALAAATRGGQSIHVVAPGTNGELEVRQTIVTPGAITGIAARNPQSGKYWQFVAGVHTADGPRLLIYSGGVEGLTPVATIALPGDATAFASGNLDGDGVPDLLVIAGGQPAILHGSSQRFDPVAVPYSVAAAALGNFVFDRDPLSQMALLASDGSLHIVAREGMDNTPWTTADMRVMRQRAVRAARTHAARPPATERSIAWKEIESYAGFAPSGPQDRSPILFRTRVSSNAADDVAAAGAAGVSVLTHPDRNPAAGIVLRRGDLAHGAAAAIPARVNVDARPGIVYVAQGGSEPSAIMPLPDPTFTVNTTTDLVSANVHACLNAVAGQCSLRQAVIEANATAGTDTIMVPAGTYTLTRSYTGQHNAQNGALDVTDSVNIVGAGQSTTIIQGGTSGIGDPGGPNGVDKVFSFNQDIETLSNASVQVSSLTIQRGFNRGNENVGDGWGGAFDFDTGTFGSATLQLTDVTITNNTVAQGEGGGFALFNTAGGPGSVTATNCIISNNVIHPDSLTAGGNGGGIAVEGSASLTLVTSQVTGNRANAANGVSPSGGGIYFVGGEFSSNNSFVNGSVVLQGVTVQNNAAGGSGGGIYDGGGMNIGASGATLSSVIGNQSGGDGGGILSDAGGQFQARPLFISNTVITGNSTTGTAGSGNGLGGGIKINQSGGFTALNMIFSRLAGNTCVVGGGGVTNPGANLAVQNATVNVAHNWWGTNTPLNTIDSYSGATVNLTPYLELTVSAPSPVTDNTADTTTVTAGFLTDSGNNAVGVNNLGVVIGLPIAFGGAVDGTLSIAQNTIQNTGTATATFTGTHVGNGAAAATVDAQTTIASIAVNSDTSIAASNATATFSASAQNVTLNAAISALTVDTVAGGTVTFALTSGGQPIGTAVVSSPVTAGTASATYVLPAGTPVGTYTIDATYNGTSTGTGDFLASSNASHTLVVGSAPTSIVTFDQSVGFNGAAQGVTLSATVTSPTGAVNEGTVTFVVSIGITPVGTPTTSSTVSNGAASVSYTLPGGTPLGTYAIHATYNPSADFQGSIATQHTLVVHVGATCTLGGATGVADVQQIVNQAIGASPVTDDPNSDGVVNVVDVQILINAALHLGCSTS